LRGITNMGQQVYGANIISQGLNPSIASATLTLWASSSLPRWLALKLHYKRNTPLATHICVAKSPNKCCYDLYQCMLYVLLKVALQGSIATHIYALVSDVYKCCKLAMDVSMFHQRIHVLL
jgi:hypothetical protein